MKRILLAAACGLSLGLTAVPAMAQSALSDRQSEQASERGMATSEATRRVTALLLGTLGDPAISAASSPESLAAAVDTKAHAIIDARAELGAINRDLSTLPPALNPARHKAWGVDSFVFFPNFMLLVWEPGWYLTYHYWPTSHNRHVFEGTLYFAPPKSATERVRQELAAVTFKEYALQDGNTLEATQSMLESRAVTEFPLCDQEVILRHLHTTAKQWVAEHQQGRATPVRVSAAS